MRRSRPARATASSLEVQICSRKTGELITNAKPTITLSDSIVMRTHVQAAMMRGVEADANDVHYGNNVMMPMGQKLTVKITLDGETASLTVQMPIHA